MKKERVRSAAEREALVLELYEADGVTVKRELVEKVTAAGFSLVVKGRERYAWLFYLNLANGERRMIACYYPGKKKVLCVSRKKTYVVEDWKRALRLAFDLAVARGFQPTKH